METSGLAQQRTRALAVQRVARVVMGRSVHFLNKTNTAEPRPDKSGNVSNRYAFGAFQTVFYTLEQASAHILAGRAVCVADCGGWRKEDNYRSAQLMGIDFDGGIDIHEAAGLEIAPGVRLGDVAFLIYRTPSWKEEKPKCRALIALTDQISAAPRYKLLTKRLLHAAKNAAPQADVDTACKDSVRIFYGSTVAAPEGYHIARYDAWLPVEVLEALPPHPDELYVPAPFVPTVIDERNSDRALKYAQRAYEQILGRAISTPAGAGQRHEAYNKAVYTLIGMAKGGWPGFENIDTTLERLGRAMDRDDVEIRASIKGAWKKAPPKALDLPDRPRPAPRTQPERALAQVTPLPPEPPYGVIDLDADPNLDTIDLDKVNPKALLDYKLKSEAALLLKGQQTAVEREALPNALNLTFADMTVLLHTARGQAGALAAAMTHHIPSLPAVFTYKDLSVLIERAGMTEARIRSGMKGMIAVGFFVVLDTDQEKEDSTVIENNVTKPAKNLGGRPAIRMRLATPAEWLPKRAARLDIVVEQEAYQDKYPVLMTEDMLKVLKVNPALAMLHLAPLQERVGDKRRRLSSPTKSKRRRMRTWLEVIGRQPVQFAESFLENYTTVSVRAAYTRRLAEFKHFDRRPKGELGMMVGTSRTNVLNTIRRAGIKTTKAIIKLRGTQHPGTWDAMSACVFQQGWLTAMSFFSYDVPEFNAVYEMDQLDRGRERLLSGEPPPPPDGRVIGSLYLYDLLRADPTITTLVRLKSEQKETESVRRKPRPINVSYNPTWVRRQALKLLELLDHGIEYQHKDRRRRHYYFHRKSRHILPPWASGGLIISALTGIPLHELAIDRDAFQEMLVEQRKRQRRLSYTTHRNYARDKKRITEAWIKQHIEAVWDEAHADHALWLREHAERVWDEAHADHALWLPRHAERVWEQAHIEDGEREWLAQIKGWLCTAMPASVAAVMLPRPPSMPVLGRRCAAPSDGAPAHLLMQREPEIKALLEAARSSYGGWFVLPRGEVSAPLRSIEDGTDARLRAYAEPKIEAVLELIRRKPGRWGAAAWRQHPRLLNTMLSAVYGTAHPDVRVWHREEIDHVWEEAHREHGKRKMVAELGTWIRDLLPPLALPLLIDYADGAQLAYFLEPRPPEPPRDEDDAPPRDEDDAPSSSLRDEEIFGYDYHESNWKPT